MTEKKFPFQVTSGDSVDKGSGITNIQLALLNDGTDVAQVAGIRDSVVKIHIENEGFNELIRAQRVKRGLKKKFKGVIKKIKKRCTVKVIFPGAPVVTCDIIG